MENLDIELIERFREEDAELNALWDLHKTYEQQLQKLEKKSYLSPVEQTEVKELKKKKLAGKTRLQAILDRYKSQE
jgi:uncharacterized protein YdcH (DUF465 family)